MKKHWWKILGVLILLYVFIIGLLAPLSPGIVESSPQNGTMGKTLTLKIKGYNSFFTEAKSPIRAWLLKDTEFAICAKAIDVQDDVHLLATFDIPKNFPSSRQSVYLDLTVNSDNDGILVYPSAVSISTATTPDSATAIQAWTQCPIEDLHINKSYNYPFRNLLVETIRNTYFHVPFWFGMIIIFMISLVYSIRYLNKPLELKPAQDIRAVAFVQVGVLFGCLGLATGALWATYTWGSPWSFDIKQNMSAICMLIYMAYFVLRGSFDDEQQRARLSAIYNIFAFAAMIPLLFVIPRMYDSLHPGNGGNPGFGGDDMDNTMRTIFYPAIIGFTLFGVWMANLLVRMETIQQKLLDDEF